MTGSPAGDVERLRARYQDRGEAFLEGVEGRFAVALRDRARGRALIARDGLGHAGLAYVLDERRFAVARESAMLAALEDVDAAADEVRAAEFYANAELSGARTFFRGVRCLLPGEQIVVDAAGMRRRALARPRPEARLRLARYEQYVERFAELLAESVARCLRGTEGVAVLASGGLDSAPIAAHAARQLAGSRRGVSLLSWDVEDHGATDRPFVTALAGALGVGVEWISAAGAEPFAELESWPVHPSTPEQTAYRWLHQRSYARAAALGQRVVLTGFGGDALYGNAPRWWLHLLGAQGPGVAIDRLRGLAAEVGWPAALRACLAAPLRRCRPTLESPAWMTAAARERLAGRPGWPPGGLSARRPRQAARLLALLDGHGEQVESWYTAAHGVEQRTPLRDARLVEFALAVPDHLLAGGAETRPVLRAAIRGLVPEEIRVRRGKADFRALVLAALVPERLGWARPLLSSEEAAWRGTVEAAFVARWLDGRFDSDAERVGLLQCLYGELWRRRRLSRTEPPSPGARAR